ncbi:protein of unknown function [Acidithiobacillus ferrivorans]|uniref:Uncharacterized protein n=1 Tax=Acidithiobacillus ferrivorans TaxID=160808 RepID=A0A060UZS2_9PROT|nr:hypothetical protein AFERRI_90009 [Acidithiobacillus ferrivorans]SMH66509.1 protein of unknown function [Acidithiobacillus ferrivorans]
MIITPPTTIFTKRSNASKYKIYLKLISIPKTLNEKYMITPTAGVMLKNKKYFITFTVAFDIPLYLFIYGFLLRSFFGCRKEIYPEP